MDEKMRLQRKLIPFNIVVMVLSLVAALSILFAPLLVIDVGAITAEISKMQESGDTDESQSSSSGGLNYISTIADCLQDTKISLSTLSIAKAAFAKEPAQMVTDAVAGELKKSEDKIVATVAVEMLPQLIQDSDLDLDLDVENIDVESVLNKFNDVFAATNDEDSNKAIADLVDEIQKQAVTTEGEKLIPDDIKEDIQEVIKEYYDQAKELLGEEELTMESFICVTISNLMNGGFGEKEPEGNMQAAQPTGKHLNAADMSDGNSGSNPETSEDNPKIYTNYKDLIGGLLENSGSEEQNPIDSINETVNQIKPYLQYVFYAMIAFAAIWLILFIFAFVRLFLQNKRFTMWYVKIFGFIPCLLFGVIPLLSGMIVNMLIADVAMKTSFAAIIGAISSLTWISGACYIALWLISIFWAFPIKHKIRKLS